MTTDTKEDEDLVLLTTCSDNLEASSLQSWLEANGVYCFLQGEHHRGLLGPLGPYIQLRVLVPRSKLELAQALALARLAPATIGEPDFEEGDDDESDDEAPGEQRRMGLRAIALLLLVGPIGMIVGLAVHPGWRPDRASQPAAPVNLNSMAGSPEHYFTMACNDGSADACIRLGELYERGAGVPKDLARAAALYDKACKAGVASACAWAPPPQK